MKARTLLLILIAIVATGQVSGQKRSRFVTVTGLVTDTTMTPVYGALIVVDGESTGLTTKRNGTFKLNLKHDVSSVGAYTSNMGSAATRWDGQSEVNLVLDGRTGLINFTPEIPEGEKGIEVGYGVVRKKDLTTNVGYINGQDDSFEGYTNIYDMIQGRIPGVTVSGTKILIRGINSINSGTDPLLVVDGIVVSTIDNISPIQVKSISVLKGSDAAIYGSRGAGGVILITLVGAGK